MISILGIQRVALLAGLLGLNLLIFALTYFFVGPQADKIQRDVMMTRAQGNTIQQEIDRLQYEFDQIDIQQEMFDEISADGFFTAQGRRQAEQVLRTVQDESGVFNARVEIRPADRESNEEAQKAEHAVLYSPVNIRVEAYDDIDVFRYIYLLRRNFPGYLSIEGLRLNRARDLDAEMLRNITLEQAPVPVEATLSLGWRTMVPNSVAPAEQGGF